MKALLAFHAQPIPRSHDLDELQRLCLTVYSDPEPAALDLAEATAEEGVTLATRVLEIIRAVHGSNGPEESLEPRE